MAEKLSRERIVSTAIDLVDREGLKALSMRRLGAELEVDPMAVYYHIPNKDALLDAIVEAVMSAIDMDCDDPEASTEDRVLAASCAYRDAMLAHANALPVVLERGPSTLAALRPVELLVKILREGGMEPAEAVAGMNVIASAVRGAVIMFAGVPAAESEKELEAMAGMLPPDQFPYMAEAIPHVTGDIEAEFEWGVRALTRGLLEAGTIKS